MMKPTKKNPKKLGKKLLLAFDLGGTKLASGVTDWAGNIIAEKKQLIDFSLGKKAFINFLINTAQFWQEQYPAVSALGIASCGPLDPKKGTLEQPTNFPKWGRFNVVQPIQRQLKIPVFLNNDSAAAAGAEGWIGDAKKLTNWMTLTFGTGLGTGIVMNRKIFLGGSGLGNEAGHMIITDKKYLCGCSNYGCAEAILSGTALRNRIHENSVLWKSKNIAPPNDNFELIARFKQQDVVSCQIFSEYLHYLAIAIHNYCIVFNPQCIYFAGGLANEISRMIPSLKAMVAKKLESRPGYEPQLKISKIIKKSNIVFGAWVAYSALNKKNELL